MVQWYKGRVASPFPIMLWYDRNEKLPGNLQESKILPMARTTCTQSQLSTPPATHSPGFSLLDIRITVS